LKFKINNNNNNNNNHNNNNNNNTNFLQIKNNNLINNNNNNNEIKTVENTRKLIDLKVTSEDIVNMMLNPKKAKKLPVLKMLNKTENNINNNNINNNINNNNNNNVNNYNNNNLLLLQQEKNEKPKKKLLAISNNFKNAVNAVHTKKIKQDMLLKQFDAQLDMPKNALIWSLLKKN
jgi:hypothetical protein